MLLWRLRLKVVQAWGWRVDWLLATGYGAIGGLIVEAVVSSERILAWNLARHEAINRAIQDRPGLTSYVDPWSDIAAAVTRIALGALAGWLFHSQVTGAYAAIAVGCSAPTVLRQLGAGRIASTELAEGGAEGDAAEDLLQSPQLGHVSVQEGG